MKQLLAVIVCIFGVVIAFCPQVVDADVYYHYQTPNRIYVGPDPYTQLGHLLGAMIQSSNQRAAQQKQEKLRKEIQATIDKNAQDDVSAMIKIASSDGVYGLWSAMEQVAYSAGATPYKNIAEGIATLSYAQEIENGIQIFREYSININTQQCRAIIKLLPIGMQSVYVSYYPSSVQEQFQNQAQAYADAQNNPVVSVGKYLGITTSSEKTKEGGFSVLNITTGGLSDFAGLKEGDILTKIDTYNLKDFDLERVASYVDLRRKNKAVIKVTILRGGESKIVEIQL
jgi:hypothetical protein